MSSEDGVQECRLVQGIGTYIAFVLLGVYRGLVEFEKVIVR